MLVERQEDHWHLGILRIGELPVDRNLHSPLMELCLGVFLVSANGRQYDLAERAIVGVPSVLFAKMVGQSVDLSVLVAELLVVLRP